MVDQRHFDLWRLRKPEDRIARPIHAGDAGAVEPHFFMKSAAECLEDASLHLVAQAIGIHNEPAIVNAGNATHLNLSARAIDRDFHRRRNVIFLLFVPHVSDAAADQQVALRRLRVGRRTRLPTNHVRRALERFDGARVGKPAQAELHRINSRRRCHFIGEALRRENVGDFSRRAKIGNP